MTLNAKQPSSRQGASQTVSTGITSAASTAFGARIGDGTPTAVTADTLLPANCTPEEACEIQSQRAAERQRELAESNAIRVDFKGGR
jgi:hypothetical protein